MVNEPVKSERLITVSGMVIDVTSLRAVASPFIPTDEGSVLIESRVKLLSKVPLVLTTKSTVLMLEKVTLTLTVDTERVSSFESTSFPSES